MGQIHVEKNAGGIEGLCVIEPTVHGDARGYSPASQSLSPEIRDRHLPQRIYVRGTALQ